MTKHLQFTNGIQIVTTIMLLTCHLLSSAAITTHAEPTIHYPMTTVESTLDSRTQPLATEHAVPMKSAQLKLPVVIGMYPQTQQLGSQYVMVEQYCLQEKISMFEPVVPHSTNQHWLNNTVCGLQQKTSLFEHVMFHSTKYHVAKFAFQLLAVLKPVSLCHLYNMCVFIFNTKWCHHLHCKVR